jgi:hypothetical protein
MGECFSDVYNDAIDRTYFSKENIYLKVSVNLIHIIYISSLSSKKNLHVFCSETGEMGHHLAFLGDPSYENCFFSQTILLISTLNFKK